jgi:hypothetical protein
MGSQLDERRGGGLGGLAFSPTKPYQLGASQSHVLNQAEGRCWECRYLCPCLLLKSVNYFHYFFDFVKTRYMRLSPLLLYICAPSVKIVILQVMNKPHPQYTSMCISFSNSQHRPNHVQKKIIFWRGRVV